MANGNFGGGNGTSASPFLIQDNADLANMGSNPTAYFKLANDITINTPLPPIQSFSGQLEGDNRKIINFQTSSNFWINSLTNGILKNFIIENPILVVRSGQNSLICFSVSGSAQLYNINLTGSLTFSNPSNISNATTSLYVGTLSGTTSSISNCTNFITDTIQHNASFSIFSSGSPTSSAKVINCKNYMNIISSGSSVCLTTSPAEDCINYGDFTYTSVTSRSYSPITTDTALRCSNYGNTSSTATSAGVRVSGISVGNAIDCANYGNVTGTYISGITHSGAIRCANYGNISHISGFTSSAGYVGGISASTSSVTDCFFAGQIYVNPSSVNVYYGNYSSSSSNNVRLKVLDISQINIVGG